MSTISIKATTREETGKKVAALRKQGLIPAVLYGHNVKNQNLTINLNEFNKVFAAAGTSTLINVEIEGGKTASVVVEAIQREPVLHIFTHVDFKQIDLKEKITVDVPLSFVGESAAVKLGGVIITNMESVEVKCLPGNMPHDFEVDISKLENLEDHFAVKDLVLSDNLELVSNPEDVIVLVKAQKVEVEEEVVAPAESTEEAEKDTKPEDKKEEVKK